MQSNRERGAADRRATHTGWPGDRTAISDTPPEKVRNRLLEQIPQGRFGRVDEVARAVASFVSPHADYITGTGLSINREPLM
jgi:NAD(P)-dependent dehydrogenase (short-subunit alcohol dehydrogenase family)